MSGEVLLTVRGGKPTLLKPGDPLPLNADVSVVGVDSSLTMAFPDGSVFELEELTQLDIASANDTTRRRLITLRRARNDQGERQEGEGARHQF